MLLGSVAALIAQDVTATAADKQQMQMLVTAPESVASAGGYAAGALQRTRVASSRCSQAQGQIKKEQVEVSRVLAGTHLAG